MMITVVSIATDNIPDVLIFRIYLLILRIKIWIRGWSSKTFTFWLKHGSSDNISSYFSSELLILRRAFFDYLDQLVRSIVSSTYALVSVLISSLEPNIYSLSNFFNFGNKEQFGLENIGQKLFNDV